MIGYHSRMQKQDITHPPLTGLACVNPACELYGQRAADSLTVRKVYGADQIRYLRCRRCCEEFGERKNTAPFNYKIGEARQTPRSGALLSIRDGMEIISLHDRHILVTGIQLSSAISLSTTLATSVAVVPSTVRANS